MHLVQPTWSSVLDMSLKLTVWVLCLRISHKQDEVVKHFRK